MTLKFMVKASLLYDFNSMVVKPMGFGDMSWMDHAGPKCRVANGYMITKSLQSENNQV